MSHTKKKWKRSKLFLDYHCNQFNNNINIQVGYWIKYREQQQSLKINGFIYITPSQILGKSPLIKIHLCINCTLNILILILLLIIIIKKVSFTLLKYWHRIVTRNYDWANHLHAVLWIRQPILRILFLYNALTFISPKALSL